MNPTTSTSSTGPSTSSGASSSNQRKERGAIAAQACETCRSRKQKCDEARPKCGLCSRMKLECNYREPQPTKKDRTLVEILERLKAIEDRLSTLPMGAPLYAAQSAPLRPQPYGEMAQQSSFATQLSQQLGQGQPPMMPSPQPHPQASMRSSGSNTSSNPNSGGTAGESNANDILGFQGDVWQYVVHLETQIRELQARLERVESEKNSLVGRLTDTSNEMEM